MAARYFVTTEATANWNDTSNWAASSGGATGETVPTSADNVFFDAASFSVDCVLTIDAAASFADMDWTGLDQAVTLSSSVYALNCYGTLTMPATNLTVSLTGTAYWYWKSTAAETITMGSPLLREFNRMYFDGVGGSWELQDPWQGGNTQTIIQNGSYTDVSTGLYMLLTSTGDGTGVSTITLEVSADITLELDGTARFYSDAAGTLDESTTWLVTSGADRTRYLKCPSGTANLTFTNQKNVTEWRAWTSSTNAASLSGHITGLTNATYLYLLGSNTCSGSVAGLTSLNGLSLSGFNTCSGSMAALTSLNGLTLAGFNTCSGSVAALTSLTYLFLYGSNTCSGSVAALTSLATLALAGSNTCSGDLSGLTSCTYFLLLGNSSWYTSQETIHLAPKAGLAQVQLRLYSANTYGEIRLGGASTNGFKLTDQSATITTLTIDAGRTVEFTGGNTYTLTNEPSISGTAGNLVTISSVTAAAHTLARAAGQTWYFEGDYLDISYSTVDANVWFAGRNSVNSGNNVNWVFGELLRLSGSLDGVGNVVAELRRELRLVGSLDGSGDLVGELRRELRLVGSLEGVGNLIGELRRELRLVGSLEGSGNVEGFLSQIPMLYYPLIEITGRVRAIKLIGYIKPKEMGRRQNFEVERGRTVSIVVTVTGVTDWTGLSAKLFATDERGNAVIIAEAGSIDETANTLTFTFAAADTADLDYDTLDYDVTLYKNSLVYVRNTTWGVITLLTPIQEDPTA